MDDEPRLAQMLSAANVILTARLDRPDGKLVGAARGVTDFAWFCYLAELAVSREMQGRGIGRGLLQEARRRLGPRVSIVLASMPGVVGFYERAGMTPLPDTFWFNREI